MLSFCNVFAATIVQVASVHVVHVLAVHVAQPLFALQLVHARLVEH
jgi:hypothetical protein